MRAPLLIASLLLPAVPASRAAPAAAQEAAPDELRGRRVVATQTAISASDAELSLEFADGSTASFALTDGGVYVDGRRVGDYEPGAALDSSWRQLLTELRVSPEGVAARLLDWESPDDEAGQTLDDTLEAMISGDEVSPATPVAPRAVDANDTVARLQQRIQELQERLDEAQIRSRVEVVRDHGRDRGFTWSPVRHVMNGIAGILSTLAVYAVLLGLGFAVVFFGGRQYLEAVADTARNSTLRSGLVGFAASFLLLPAFIVGALVLAVSIVGIPALIVWIPLFPLAVVLAALFGYLGVAHAAGEALAERRFYGGEWFKRANSYYYLLTGVGLLLVLCLAANVMQMAGPFLGFLEGLLKFLGIVVTWLAATVGFGAVLVSRGGIRAQRVADGPAEPMPETEATGV